MTVFEFLMAFAEQHPFLSFCAILAVGELGNIGSTRNTTKVKIKKDEL